MNTINQCRQSLSILVKWLSDTDGLVNEPKDLHDVESYELVALTAYSNLESKKEREEMIHQCRIVGLNNLANDFENSLGIATLEGSQELMNNN
jgi:hypothetical protein